MTDDRVLKVLIADDEQGMRMGARRTLEKTTVIADHNQGEFTFEITEAVDGDDARAKLDETEFDIALLDHSMPGCTGLEILEDLKDQEGSPLAIMATAYASLDMAVRATKQGAFDFLAKPFTPDELREVIRKASHHLIAHRSARKLAKEKRRVRFEFLSVLAHELKAPLGAVEGYLRLLEEGIVSDKPETTERMVQRCLERLDGMRKLIFDLLDLTRIESGQKARELQEVNLEEVAWHAVETMRPDADVRKIELNLSVDGDAKIQSDPGEMLIIMNNLVSNAVKYNRDGGRVDIKIGITGGLATIAVSDTGIGMSEEEVSRLFGEFVRIKNDKTRKIQGSGLGLSILRRLARLNGGDVTVTSVEDEGTTFTATISSTQGESE